MPDDVVVGPQVIAAAFVEKGGKFLLLFCPRFKVWRVPGGRVSKEERIVGALEREMREELGVTIENPKFLGYGQDHQYHVRDGKETSRLLLFFHVKITQEPRIDPAEAEAHKWVTLNEMRAEQNKEGGLTEFLEKLVRFARTKHPELKF